MPMIGSSRGVGGTLWLTGPSQGIAKGMHTFSGIPELVRDTT